MISKEEREGILRRYTEEFTRYKKKIEQLQAEVADLTGVVTEVNMTNLAMFKRNERKTKRIAELEDGLKDCQDDYIERRTQKGRLKRRDSVFMDFVCCGCAKVGKTVADISHTNGCPYLLIQHLLNKEASDDSGDAS